tara:strand:- start:883 stop:1461 length:579 start_codon:yes stop_codon:yes gene_type:complete
MPKLNITQKLSSANSIQEKGTILSKEWSLIESQTNRLFSKSVHVGMIFGEFVVNNNVTAKNAKHFGITLKKNAKVILSKVRTLFNNKELAQEIIKKNPNIKSFETLSKRISASLNKNKKTDEKPLAIEDKSSTVEQSSSTEEVKTKQVSAFDIAFEAIAKADSLGIKREELIKAFKENLTLLDEENNQKEVA